VQADEALYLLADVGSATWLQKLRPTARSLHHHYTLGRRRPEIYADVVEEIVGLVRKGLRVCAALYGHPGVFSFVGHEAVRQARREGFRATMLPAVSAADCLFADLGVDPGQAGLQTYEATDFLVNRRHVDTAASLILWQVSVIGEQQVSSAPNLHGLRVLADRLQELYPEGHEVTLYEASPYPICDATVRTVPLARLHRAELSALATLYVPPARRPEPDPAVLELLGLEGGD
jgi:uncharacterized protein YabN with tetrapyrrole methylase and pyrophosphatase domain